MHDFAGSVPEMYDRHLGPVIFEPYAQDFGAACGSPKFEVALCWRLRAVPACSRQRLFELLPVDVELVATDLNEPMVEFCTEQVRGRPGSGGNRRMR